MSQPPTSGAFLPHGDPHQLTIAPNAATPLSSQNSFGSIYVPEINSMIPEPLTATSTTFPPHAESQVIPSSSEPPTAVPTPPLHAANPAPKKRKRKANPKITGDLKTDKASDRNAVRKQNVEARLSALETLADVYEAPPPTMRAPPPTTVEPRLSDARDIWYHQYPVESKPVCPFTQPEINALIPIVKKYQAELIFDQIQHPSPESEAMLCICCLLEGVTKVYLNREGGITGGIRDHMKKVHPAEYYAKCMQEGLHDRCKDLSPDTLCGGQPKFTLDGFLDRLVRWIVLDDQAFNLLEIPEFRDLMLYSTQGLLKDSELPHRDKLELLAYAMYRIEKDAIDKDMQINGHHTGVNISHALHGVLQESGIVDKLGFITLDNASNNDTAMVELAENVQGRGGTFHPEWSRIRCFPHVLNLAVQTILQSIRSSAMSYRRYMAKYDLAISPETEQYLQAMESDPVDACRASITACRSSGTRRDKFESVIKLGNRNGLFRLPNGDAIQLEDSQLLRDCITRWGSTFLMMERYEKMTPAVRELAFQMRDEAIIPVLTHKQFEVMQDLISVLRIPYNAQQLLSSEKTPTLALAIPLYESLIVTWEKVSSEIPELSHAITCGISKLQDYLGIARDVPVHTLAMFINPLIKLTWIQEHWGPSAEREAEESIVSEMMQIQRSRPSPPSARSTVSARQATRAQNSGYLRVLAAGVNFRRASDLNLAPELPSRAPSAAENAPPMAAGPSAYEVEQRNRQIVLDEYQKYLNETSVSKDKEGMSSLDLVQFWVNHQCTYPNLYQIAMNILPAQASSVSSERVFSSSKLTMTAQRSRLSATNMEYLQVLKHALQRQRRDLVNGTGVDSDGLDFVSHLFTNMTVNDDDLEAQAGIQV